MLGARNIAIRYCDKNGLEPTFDDVLIPAVRLAGEERIENHASSQENQRLINDTTVALVKELGDRFSKPRTASRLRILGICVPGEFHRMGLQMLLELLRRAGAAANFLDESKSSAQIRDFVKALCSRHGISLVHHERVLASRGGIGARTQTGFARSNNHLRRTGRTG